MAAAKKTTKTKSAPKRATLSAANRAAIDVADELRAATAALERDDFAAAVAHVARAWTAAPTERLGPIAAAIDRRLPRRDLPAKVAERETAWLEIAGAHDPKDLPTLLGCDWPTHPREAKARLSELVEFPPDPRIADALIGLRTAKRYRSNSGDAFWKLAFLTIASWGDPRVAPLAEAAKTAEDIDWWGVFQPLKAKLKLPGPIVLDEPVVAAIEPLEALVAQERPASSVDLPALFEAVYEDPASDGPRLVLADALLAQEDPRGEFIQLQLSGKGGKAAARAKALLRSHGARWLDGIEAAGEPVFRRGFVAEVVIGSPIKNPPRAWRTVETIRFFTPPNAAELGAFITHDSLAGVTSLGPIPVEAVPVLAGRELDSLRMYGVRQIAAAPRVRELWVGWDVPEGRRLYWQVFDWFGHSRFAGRVQHLCVDAVEGLLATACAWFLGAAPLSRLSLRPMFGLVRMAWDLELAREGDGLSLTATWHGHSVGEHGPGRLAPALVELPAATLVRFTATTAVPLDDAVIGRLKKELTTALARQTQLASTSLFE